MKFIFHNNRGIRLKLIKSFRLRTDFNCPRVEFFGKNEVNLGYFEFINTHNAECFLKENFGVK